MKTTPRACYAALAMQEAIRHYSAEVRRTHGVEVRIRVGLNSGEVVVRAIDNDLHPAKRLFGLLHHLEDALGCEVGLLTISSLRNPYFCRRVVKERVNIYDGCIPQAPLRYQRSYCGYCPVHPWKDIEEELSWLS